MRDDYITRAPESVLVEVTSSELLMQLQLHIDRLQHPSATDDVQHPSAAKGLHEFCSAAKSLNVQASKLRTTLGDQLRAAFEKWESVITLSGKFYKRCVATPLPENATVSQGSEVSHTNI